MKVITKVCSSCRLKYQDDIECTLTTCQTCSNSDNRSSLEEKLFNIVKVIRPTAQNNVNILVGSEKEIDIYIPELKLAIEFNGLIWHSEINSLQQGKDKKRDYNKFLLCKKNQLSHILIYEDEFLYKYEQVLNFLEYHLDMYRPVNDDKVYAKRIKGGSGKEFFDKYSIYPTNAKAQFIGIYMKHTHLLLGAVAVTKHRDKLEIDGYAWLPEHNIKHSWYRCRQIIDLEFRPNKLAFFSDNRLNQEEFAYAMNLRPVSNVEPAPWYFKYPEGIRMHPSTVSSKIKDTSLTEWEKMLIDGWNRIWDCGARVWISK